MGTWPVLKASRWANDDVAGPTYNTALTIPAAINTLGAWTQVIATTPFDADAVEFSVELTNATTYFVDIGIGAAGSEVVLVGSLFFDTSLANATDNLGPFLLPIKIPKGTRVAMRTQMTTVTSRVVNVKVHLLGGSFVPLQGATRWETWGAVASTSQGTPLSPGTGAKGAFVQLFAATSFDTRWVIICVDCPTGTATDALVDIAIGAAAAEQVIIPDLYFRSTHDIFVALPLTIPGGSRVSARGQVAVAVPMTAVLIGGR